MLFAIIFFICRRKPDDYSQFCRKHRWNSPPPSPSACPGSNSIKMMIFFSCNLFAVDRGNGSWFSVCLTSLFLTPFHSAIVVQIYSIFYVVVAFLLLHLFALMKIDKSQEISGDKTRPSSRLMTRLCATCNAITQINHLERSLILFKSDMYFQKDSFSIRLTRFLKFYVHWRLILICTDSDDEVDLSNKNKFNIRHTCDKYIEKFRWMSLKRISLM